MALVTGTFACLQVDLGEGRGVAVSLGQCTDATASFSAEFIAFRAAVGVSGTLAGASLLVEVGSCGGVFADVHIGALALAVEPVPDLGASAFKFFTRVGAM